MKCIETATPASSEKIISKKVWHSPVIETLSCKETAYFAPTNDDPGNIALVS